MGKLNCRYTDPLFYPTDTVDKLIYENILIAEQDIRWLQRLESIGSVLLILLSHISDINSLGRSYCLI